MCSFNHHNLSGFIECLLYFWMLNFVLIEHACVFLYVTSVFLRNFEAVLPESKSEICETSSELVRFQLQLIHTSRYQYLVFTKSTLVKFQLPNFCSFCFGISNFFCLFVISVFDMLFDMLFILMLAFGLPIGGFEHSICFDRFSIILQYFSLSYFDL